MDEMKILVVDDETANLQKLRRTFIDRFPVLAAASGNEALELIRKNDGIAVIIADQRMPDMTGVELLRHTLRLLPDAVRIILTGYTDVEVLMEAINSCKVYRYVVKPWDPPDLLMTVERGIEAYRLARENERFRKELVRRERLARELEIASEIQRYILPPRYPELAGYEIAVEYHPAREVGGDLYDFDWNREAGTLQIVIGDVSGKSIPAALYGAVFSGQLRTLFAQSLSPGETLARANSSLIARYQVSNYIAAACMRIEPQSGLCVLANGGMPLPYLVRAGDLKRLHASGIPLGLLEGSSYDELPFRMEKGDLLIFASDGATDAVDPEGQMFDEERFIESIRRYSSEGAVFFAQRLYQAICEFTHNADVHDDITILALRRSA
ncbi:MAG: SpoIIE family protein phosphatase [Acidobacteriia bacterium]|nr:SpoIIE family protein phosphatase [Terriglobia bacterium]